MEKTVNEAGNEAGSITVELPNITSKMIFKRARIGADTPHGHAISNTIEILENMRNYVRPDWATHKTQTLAWQLRWQADHMAKPLRAAGG